MPCRALKVRLPFDWINTGAPAFLIKLTAVKSVASPPVIVIVPPKVMLKGVAKKMIGSIMILPVVTKGPVVLMISVSNSFTKAPIALTLTRPEPVRSEMFFGAPRVDRMVPVVNTICPPPAAVNVVVAPEATGNMNCDEAV